MRKFLIAAAAFLVSTVAGVILLAVGSILVMLPQIAQQRTSGIGAVAGGISGIAAFLVPLLCGVLGTVLALRRMNRPRL